MVLVEDVSSNSPNRSQNSATTSPRNSTRASPSLMQILLDRKVDSILLLSRLATILFTIFYFLKSLQPTNEPNVYYSKALLSSIVTSALRLHQRIPQFELSREFFFNLIHEDSAHYLIYSFLFLSGSQMTIVLLPVSTYAMLHSCSFLSQILTDYPRIKLTLDRITASHGNVLRFIALNEILLMPILILSIFIARSNLLLIFMYYQFLTLRYRSHRNPYTKILFGELRVQAEQICNHPSCPQLIARLCHGSISFISRLAPIQN